LTVQIINTENLYQGFFSAISFSVFPHPPSIPLLVEPFANGLAISSGGCGRAGGAARGWKLELLDAKIELDGADDALKTEKDGALIVADKGGEGIGALDG